MARIKEIAAIASDLRRLADELEILVDRPDETVPPNQDREEVAITLEELRAFVAERSGMENRPKIKAILTRFGVNKLTELPPAQYVALKNEVAVL